MAYKINLFDYTLDDCEYCIGYGNLSQQNIQWEIQYAGGQDLEVHISSVGGSLFDAIAIYDMLKKYPGKVTTYIDAIAASAASVVAMAGQTVIMGKYALLMIHKPSTAQYGTADDMEAAAAKLNISQSRLVAIYMDKTGLDEETINSLVNAETWLSADQAKDLGFVDMVEDYAAEISNHGKLKIYAKAAPAVYQNVFNKIEIKTPTTQEMKDTDKELIEKTNSILEKIVNFFTAKTVKTPTDKGELHSFMPLNKGVKVMNDAGEAAKDDDYTIENADGKKITAKVKGGEVENMIDPDETEGDDEDVTNKAIVNAAGIKITNKAELKGVAGLITNYTATINNNNALIADLSQQLKISNEAVSRDEKTIRDTIQSDFTPDGSKRSDTTKVVNQAGQAPAFLQKMIADNPVLDNGVKIANGAGRTPKQAR